MNIRVSVSRLLKENSIISGLYVFCMNMYIKLLTILNKSTDKRIIFVSYGGRQISDSPKRIFDLMKQDPFFGDYDLVWAVVDLDKFRDTGFHLIKIDSYEYYKMCITSRVWITNSGITRYTELKGNNTFFVNTWHGIPMKKIGVDEVGVKKSFFFSKKWEEFSNADVNLCYTDYDKNILEHVFNANGKTFYKLGLPRNDSLYCNKVNKYGIRKKLGIDDKKKVILYAPTVRGDNVKKNGVNEFDVSLNLEKWKKKLPEYVILFRAHYFVGDVEMSDESNVIDVTDYDNLNDLMQISDVLISDYSSLIYDYSILEKPIFCYDYDFERYKEYQGLYEDNIDSLVPNFTKNEDRLIDSISNMDVKVQANRTSIFKDKYIGNDKDNSGEKVVKLIKDNIE